METYGLSTKYKKAIVTGGAGFIGSHIIDQLLAEGLYVISIDDYSTGKEENLSHLKGNPNFLEVNCDITDKSKLEKYFEGVDIVFHEAASKKTICLRDPIRDLFVNAGGAFNLLELCRDYKVKKYVHASTGSVYGEPEVFPQDEKTPLSPTSYYGVSKLGGERYAATFNKLYDLDVTILRYFHVYGERQEYNDFGGVIPIFCRRLLSGEAPIIHGDGTQQRSFTYVKDLVKINMLAAMSDKTKGEVYNCPSSIQVTVGEIADYVKKALNMEDVECIYDDWTIGDIKYFELDNSKVKSLGIDKFTDFDEGMANTINWMKNRLGGKNGQ